MRVDGPDWSLSFPLFFPLCSSIKTQVKRSVSSSGRSVNSPVDGQERKSKRIQDEIDRLSINSLRRQVQFLRTKYTCLSINWPYRAKGFRGSTENRKQYFGLPALSVYTCEWERKRDVNAWERASKRNRVI